MIDARTGTVAVADLSERLGPGLELTAFRAMVLGGAATLVVRNTPWHTLHVAKCTIGAAAFGAMLIFENERLRTITLCLADPAGTLSYEALDAAHRRWLAAHLGAAATPWRADENERRFAWGTLSVGFDVKSGGPQIVIAYR